MLVLSLPSWAYKEEGGESFYARNFLQAILIFTKI